MAEPADRIAAAGEAAREFAVARRDESAAHGPTLTWVRGHNSVRGAIDGPSVAERLAAQVGDGRGRMASERLTGSVAGRPGTAVFRLGGLDDGRAPTTVGQIVPGPGPGGLARRAASVGYTHEESGARGTLVLGRPRCPVVDPHRPGGRRPPAGHPRAR